MEKKINGILKDLEILDASDGQDRESMAGMIKELISSRPDTRYRSSFKKELKKKLAERAGEADDDSRKTGVLLFFKERKVLTGIAAAVLVTATLFTLGIIKKSDIPPPEQIAYNLKSDTESTGGIVQDQIIPGKRPEIVEKSTRRLKRVAPMKVSPTTIESPVTIAKKKKFEGLFSKNRSRKGASGMGAETDTDDEFYSSSADRRRSKDRIAMEESIRRPEPKKSVKRELKQLEFNTEQYSRIYENEFLDAADNPLSTFSIDVDTASYSNTRRFLNSNRMPPRDAVRIEEFLNYFSYNYSNPGKNQPFSINTEIGVNPWNKKHLIAHIGLKGREISRENLPPSNLVFLIDVSGSMIADNKLGLLKKAYKMLTDELSSRSRIAIVVYAGATGLVLPSTPGNMKEKIKDALEKLQAGGPTAGAAGINLAYRVAAKNFIQGGNNRIILATDGDFNIGQSSDAELTRLIEEKRKNGIFLTVLGFGMGNYKDSKMESLADKGNGNYSYIDSVLEAKKVLVTDIRSTLFTIAKDVKIQVEFNPAIVKSYRLIGYENRMLKKEDFKDDTKDAGELGSGHTVTALYEIVPADGVVSKERTIPLKYQENRIKPDALKSGEMMTVKLRYKKPDGNRSRLIVRGVKYNSKRKRLTNNFRFSAAVAQFGLLLRKSKFRGDASYRNVLDLARKSMGRDKHSYRAEFIRMVKTAELLDRDK